MRNLLNAKWLLLLNTLPIIVLFALFFGQYSIIKTLLQESTVQLWISFGLALGLLAMLNFCYAIYLIVKKQNVSAWYAILAFLSYIPFVYLYGSNLSQIMPLNIPTWMISDNIFIYVGTFLMPTFGYSMLVLIIHLTPENKTHKPWVNFVAAISIPMAGYLFSQVIIPLWQPFSSDFGTHTLLILIIVATLLFLFFIVRGFFVLAMSKAVFAHQYQMAWKIPIAIGLPLLGLQVNNGNLMDWFSTNQQGNSGFFGNFNNQWFYILAVVNGIFVCLPQPNDKIFSLLLFAGRNITLPYTLYFLLVFLPFLPLSIIAIVAFGIGFLMLTPLILFVMHTIELSKDFQYLQTIWSQKLIITVSVLGFLILPSWITISYLKDKMVLNEALAYLYSPDYSKHYKIDKSSLEKTINVIANHSGKLQATEFRSKTPYLSTYYNWLVLDNLTLSDAKINYIEQIFFGKPALEKRPENIQNAQVEISKIATTCRYDTSQNAWRSWIDLEISNKNDNSWQSEYATTIDLPDGCWISDYYLQVGDKKEFGILAEKKSAMWVFSNIRNEQRDPGILYYLSGNKVALRVFPFAKNEVRQTGIEFLHKEPLALTIDQNSIELGNAALTAKPQKTETEHAVYVTAEQKQNLQIVQRKPYFHFIVDVSKGKNNYAGDFVERIAQVIESNKPLSENAQISYVNSYVNNYPLEKDWMQQLHAQTFEGGFFLERALKKTLINAYNATSYPVIVVVTDDIQSAVLDKDFSDFKFAFPESSLFYDLSKNGTLHAHSLIKSPVKELSGDVRYAFDEKVLAYRLSDNSMAYLPNDSMPSIILKKESIEVPESEIKAKNWMSALTMQAMWKAQVLHPNESNKEWLKMVKYSFLSKIMTPVTSYLVVENEAQRAILKQKQAHVLASNKSLDLDEDTQRMSEPSLWVLAVLLGLILWYRQKRARAAAMQP